MVGRWAYDLMYRWWAPWDRVGVRDDLRGLLSEGQVAPSTHPRAIDFGCGTGANAVFLATEGFEVTGVDFSTAALGKARARAATAGVSDRCRFVEADLTGDLTGRVPGRYDLLVDFGTLDDLDARGRAALARNVAALARPGAAYLLWCFYGSRDDLPWISFSGPSRLSPAVEPGEVEGLFGESFTIDRFEPSPHRTACFLLSRASGPAAREREPGPV